MNSGSTGPNRGQGENSSSEDSGDSRTPSAGAIVARTNGRRLGDILVRENLLEDSDVSRVMDLQREKGLSFGEACLKLGLIDITDLHHALAAQLPLTQGKGRLSEDLVVVHQPFSRPAEAIKAIRSRLQAQLLNPENTSPSIMITGTLSGEGASFLAANLALSFAQTGRETLLVDADLRHGRQHEIFGISNRTGLSSFLSGSVSGFVDICHSIPQAERLTVLPAGPPTPQPADLLSSDAFLAMMILAGRSAEILIIDTPSMRNADAEAVARYMGGVVLVARRDETNLHDLRRARDRLIDQGARVAGVVLN